MGSEMCIRDSLYPLYSPAGSAAQATDQQIAGAVLWVCGEVTFLPSILYTVARWLDEETPDMVTEPLTPPVGNGCQHALT